MRLKRGAALGLALAALLFLAACGSDDDGDDSSQSTPSAPGATAAAQATQFPANSYMAELVRKGKVTIGVKFDQPGTGVLNPVTNKVEGFDVEIGKQIAKALFGDENKAEFIETVSANRIPFLNENRVDLVIATMTINEERKQQIDFSNVYYKAGQSLLVAKDSPIQGVNDLSGRRVCSAQGSTSERNVREKAPGAEIVLFPAYAECLAALQTRRVDAVTTDDTILAGLAAQDRNLKLTGGIFTEEPYGIGIKKGHPEFVEFVNKVLDDMIKDGRWKTAYDKYLGDPSGVSSDEALKRFR